MDVGFPSLFKVLSAIYCFFFCRKNTTQPSPHISNRKKVVYDNSCALTMQKATSSFNTADFVSVLPKCSFSACHFNINAADAMHKSVQINVIK